MAQLSTVIDYVTEARRMMQDTGDLVGGNFRYPDADVVAALNSAMLEARKLRPDLFMATVGTTFVPPSFVSPADTTAVAMDYQYRMAIVYYMVGMIQLRDMEDVQDNRATQFLGIFKSQMVGM